MAQSGCASSSRMAIRGPSKKKSGRAHHEENAQRIPILGLVGQICRPGKPSAQRGQQNTHESHQPADVDHQRRREVEVAGVILDPGELFDPKLSQIHHRSINEDHEAPEDRKVEDRHVAVSDEPALTNALGCQRSEPPPPVVEPVLGLSHPPNANPLIEPVGDDDRHDRHEEIHENTGIADVPESLALGNQRLSLPQIRPPVSPPSAPSRRVDASGVSLGILTAPSASWPLDQAKTVPLKANDVDRHEAHRISREYVPAQDAIVRRDGSQSRQHRLRIGPSARAELPPRRSPRRRSGRRR